MNNCAITSILLLIIAIRVHLAQLNLVIIKSHKVLTNDIIFNQVDSIYDNNTNTKASFYSSTSQKIEVEFDIGKNYLIDHVLIRMKREKYKHELAILVGDDDGRLPYICEIVDEASDMYKCQPVCRSNVIERPGIIARRFIMKVLVPTSWISVYSINVYSVATKMSNHISSDRLVLPIDCDKATWLLTSAAVSLNKSITSTMLTDVIFEKPYIVTEVQIQFGIIAPKELEIVLVSARKENISLVISLSDCRLQNLIFTCEINKKIFPSKIVRLLTRGLTKLLIKGKPVFYPKLEMKTSMNTKQKLRMTCEYSQCDLSVHSDCTHEALKSGVKFDCLNKQLRRVPSGFDQDSYVIVNKGAVELAWLSTQFTVDSVNDYKMVVSMPRSYHYFGQFTCACIVGDQMETVITSNNTDLKAADFLEDLIFETLVQYKLSESAVDFINVSNNIIYLPKSSLDSVFIPIKVTTYSLIAGNKISVIYPLNEKESETSTVEKSTPHSIKAFESISQSWSVDTQKYVVDELYPEFVHQRAIVISCNNPNFATQNQEQVILLDEDKVKIRPVILRTGDSRMVQIKVMYQDSKVAMLYQNEKSCSSANSSVLATFTNTSCTSSDRRLTCFNVRNSTLVLFKDERNYAKEIVFDLVDSATKSSIDKVSIKNNITFTKEDVTIKHRYTSLSTSSKNKNVNVLRVEFETISKIIDDFIPCGTVIIKITIPNETEQKLVLQKSSFYVDVELTTEKVNVTITISIEGSRVEHVTEILVTDPTKYEVKDFDFQEDQEWELLWRGIDEIARDLLDSYELRIDTTILACNSTTTYVKNVQKSQSSGGKNRYQGPKIAISKKHSTSISASIQPIFIGNKRGQMSKTDKQFNNQGRSDISIGSVSATNGTFTVIASQSDLPCGLHSVNFSITGVRGELPKFTAIPLDNMEYKITMLIPGRKYQMTAKVLYKYGPEDALSNTYTFETWDDITITKNQHVAQIGEKVNISCTAKIGPKDQFPKKAEWLRADQSLLPDGVKSVVSVQDAGLVYLIMEKVLPDYSGQYGCFALPSAKFGSMSITIIVNDLDISPTEKHVDFNKISEKVTVTCSSTAVSDDNLKWLDPMGANIPEGDSAKYTIEKIVTEQKVHKSTLTIKNISVDSSGTYKCHKSLGNTKAVKEFLLYGSEKIEIETLQNSSYYVGEKIRLRCKGEVALKTQKVIWELSSIKDHDNSLVKTFYPTPSDEAIMDIEIVNSLVIHEIFCKIIPAVLAGKDPVRKGFKITLLSKVDVQGPKEVNAGQDVKLTCWGYPSNIDSQLEWLFYTKNSSTADSVITTSKKPHSNKPNEPIKLELNLTKLTEAQAGRYECKFKEVVQGRGGINRGFISLAVNSVMEPVGQVSPRNDARSPFSNNSFIRLLPALLLLLLRVFHQP